MMRQNPLAPLAHGLNWLRRSICAASVLGIGIALFAAPAIAQEKVASDTDDGDDVVIVNGTEFVVQTEDNSTQIIIQSEDGDSTVIRMVIETNEEDRDEPAICVWVPSGEGSAGALSCPDGELRVFGFGPGHNQQIIIGDNVLDEDELRAIIELRIDAMHDRLGDMDDLHIEYVGRFDQQELQREMAEFQREIAEFQRNFRFEFSTGDGMDEEERADFDEEMREFAEEMAEFGREMAQLQVEAMAELAEELATLGHLGAPAVPRVPGIHLQRSNTLNSHIEWDLSRRQLISTSRNGEKVLTLIEHTEDEDGNFSLIIRTTDASTVEVIEVDEETIRRYDD